MSYSYNQRKKTKKRFKKKYGAEKWYSKFREFVKELIEKEQGTPIGSLEDIIRMKNEPT